MTRKRVYTLVIVAVFALIMLSSLACTEVEEVKSGLEKVKSGDAMGIAEKLSATDCEAHGGTWNYATDTCQK